MSEESLIKYIASSIKDMKKTLETIDHRQQAHFNDLIGISKDVEFIKKEIDRIDEEKNEKIDHIWDEIRRRDKNSKWTIGIVAVVFVPILTFVINYLSR